MKKLVVFILFTFLTVGLFAQEKAVLDTIYKLGGRAMVVDVRKVSSSAVAYAVPGERGTKSMERKDIQKIVYNTGRVEVFNKPVLLMVEDYMWEAVVLTEKESDIEGLYERGQVSSKSQPSSRSPKAAKKSCSIRIQKKAANMKGVIVFVTHKEATGGYGEMPGYYMEGTVYGFEPLTDEEKEEMQ